MTLHNRVQEPHSYQFAPDPPNDDDDEELPVCPECLGERFLYTIDERWTRDCALEADGDRYRRYEGDADYNETIDDGTDYFACSDCGYEVWSRSGALWDALSAAL